MENINGYSLIREWYNFKFENPSKCKSVHSDFYCYIIDLWNRLGQKKEFGLPTSVTMECLGIGSYNTYKNTLNDLVNYGFIKIVSDAKNQYQSKIIAISKNDKASDKALDKANIKASDKAGIKATDTIIEQVNKETNKQIGNFFNFKKSLIDYGFEKTLVDDWLKIRKTKKATNTETAFKKFIKEIEKNGNDKNKLFEYIVSQSWSGFNSEWKVEIERNQIKIDRPDKWELRSKVIDGLYTAEYAKEKYNYNFELNDFE